MVEPGKFSVGSIRLVPQVVRVFPADHRQVRTEIQPSASTLVQRMTEHAAQAEVQPGPLLQPLLPCLSAGHVASGAACLNVRLAHQGILGVLVRPCVGDEGVESAAAASVAGGTSDPVRKMFPQARSVGSERKGDALVRQIAPLDAQVAGGTAVDFRGTRVVLADAQHHRRRRCRPGSRRETALAGHARALARRGSRRARAHRGAHRLPRETRAARGDAGVPVRLSDKGPLLPGPEEGPHRSAAPGHEGEADHGYQQDHDGRVKGGTCRPGQDSGCREENDRQDQHAGCRVEKVTKQRRPRGEPRNDPLVHEHPFEEDEEDQGPAPMTRRRGPASRAGRTIVPPLPVPVPEGEEGTGLRGESRER